VISIQLPPTSRTGRQAEILLAHLGEGERHLALSLQCDSMAGLSCAELRTVCRPLLRYGQHC